MQRHVARILAKPHKGVNPNAVLLTYRSGILDPRICAIVRAARSARRAIHTMPIVFKDFWSRLVDDPGDPNRTYNPLSVLATYFKSLGIKPHVGGYLTLQGISPVDFIDGPFASVEEILLTAWARQVQAELRERHELEDLAHVSPELTYRALKKIDPKDAKVVRTVSVVVFQQTVKPTIGRISKLTAHVVESRILERTESNDVLRLVR